MKETHTHHIIPKHAGGTNDPSNLIELTIEEHAQAHLDLWEEYGNEYDLIAYRVLSGRISAGEGTRLAIEENMERLKNHPDRIKRCRRGGFTQGAKNKESGHWDKLIEASKKEMKIIHPDGTETITRDLKVFCNEHNLCRSHLAKVARGVRKHHKGFTANYI